MFHKLRIKFILLGTLAVAISVMALIGAINAVNYIRVDKETTDTVRMLADNNGKFPEQREDMLPKVEPKETPVSPQGEDYGPSGEKGALYPVPNGTNGAFRTREFQYETRFFSAEISESGEYKYNLSQIASISEDDAADLVAKVVSGKKSMGYISEYKYYIRNIGDGNRVVVMMDCSSRFDNLRSTMLISIGVGIIGIIIMFIFLSFATKRILKPVEESEIKQKQFITDVSHELKTPLTVISTNMDVLAMDIGKNEWVTGTKEQVARMKDMVNQMVSLSRLEESEKTVAGDPFMADELLKEATEPFLAIAEYKGKDMVVEAGDKLIMNTDSNLYKQLISILCDNALKYSDEEGFIRVTLDKKGRRTVLKVMNTSDLAAGKEDLKHLFDRFYRVDSARTKSHGERSGNGIGLSIAQAITVRMGGKIGVTFEEMDENRIKELFPGVKIPKSGYVYIFTVTLPLKES